jgi:hypothetical protein
MQLGWQESLDNLQLFWGHTFYKFFKKKVVVSSNYYCDYTLKKNLIYDFFGNVF